MSGLGLDCGGSATRWVVCDQDGIVARGELPAVSGHLFNAAERERLGAMAAALRAAVSRYGVGRYGVGRAVVGVTGLSSGSDEAARFAGVVAEAVGLTLDRVVVRDDLWIGYHAAFRPGAGHVVYCGTGSIGLHVRSDGSVLRVGGRGMLIDDAGSAFWIGREALRLVWRRIDATGDAGETPLPRALATAIGAADWDSARRYVYGGGRDAVAQLARAVAQAANSGDADALGLLRRAGVELAGLAGALAAREGALPVALIGRAAGLHPAILAAMRAAVPDARLVDVDAAAAAARMGLESA